MAGFLNADPAVRRNGSPPDPDRPVILDGSGRPLYLDREGPIPHVYEFEGLLSGSWQTYWLGRHDEALRHSRENALAMFLDEHIQACLWERVRSTTKLSWHLAVDDDRDPWQKAVAEGLTKLIQQTPRLRQFCRWLLWQALWAGRSANQMRFAWTTVDVEGLGKHKGLHVAAHRPINGDKLAFRWDGTPAVLIGTGGSADLPNAETLLTTEARAVELRGDWRERFIIHKVNCCDVDFRESDRAMAIHGLGIRHFLYWSWWNKEEYISAVIKALDRVGLGLVVVEYDQSNDAAKLEAEKLAKDLSVDRSVVTIPVSAERMGASGGALRVVNTPVAGAQVMMALRAACEAREERFIVAQAGSSRSETSGLGTHDPSFMQETKADQTEEDSGELAETLTGTPHDPGLVSILLKYTYPWADFPIHWVWEVNPPDPERRLGTITMAANLGVDFIKDEVREITGLSKPATDDDVLLLPQFQQPPPGQETGAPGQPGQAPPGQAPPGQEQSPGGQAESPQTDPQFEALYGEQAPGMPQIAGGGQ